MPLVIDVDATWKSDSKTTATQSGANMIRIYIKDIVNYTIKMLGLFAIVVFVLTAFATFQRQEEKLQGNLAVIEAMSEQVKHTNLQLEQITELKKSLESQILETSRELEEERAKSAVLEQALSKAILPESSWKEVGERRIVEPTVASYEKMKSYVQRLF